MWESCLDLPGISDSWEEMHLARSPLVCGRQVGEVKSPQLTSILRVMSRPVYYRYLLGWTGTHYTHVTRTDHALSDRDLEGLRNALVLVHTTLSQAKTVPISITHLLYWVQCQLLLAESAAVRCFKCPTWWHVLHYNGFCMKSKATVWMSLNPDFPAFGVSLFYVLKGFSVVPERSNLEDWMLKVFPWTKMYFKFNDMVQ